MPAWSCRLLKTNITTTTLTDTCKHNKESVLRGLRIMDFLQSDCLFLNSLCSTKSLPVSVSDIPKPQDLVRHSVFGSISLPDVNADVGLLNLQVRAP